MTDINPTWAENNVIPQAVFTEGSSSEPAELDLRAAHGAYILPRQGRRFLGSATMTEQPRIVVTRRASEAIMDHRALVYEVFGATGVAQVTEVLDDRETGEAIMSFRATIGGPGQLGTGDTFIIHAAGTIIPAASEWNKVLRISGTGTAVLEWPLRFAHFGSPTERVVNKATLFTPTWLPGGAIYDVNVYNMDNNVRLVAQVAAQVYDKDVAT